VRKVSIDRDSENGKPECDKQSKADGDKFLEVILMIFLCLKQNGCGYMQKNADHDSKNVIKIGFHGGGQRGVKQVAENGAKGRHQGKNKQVYKSLSF
jgi:hypothetical protein